ncbi:hypothetical protein PWYN_02380 [Paenibacillus wynnii]|uniref:Uncharacterized protein n=1 Tax=Paenibacillus wynnii TaxID=268407 RepID=A0A098MG57_9BACL|nr:hypothetical protein [Paenibacillus wynnii]KGE21023.1 hypothetical protein PWYN_02380 [Paenibacillus wynnii]
MIEQSVVKQKLVKHKRQKISAEAVLRGDIKGIRRILPFLGPAFINKSQEHPYLYRLGMNRRFKKPNICANISL